MSLVFTVATLGISEKVIIELTIDGETERQRKEETEKRRRRIE